jgi:hypothetical protein
VVVDVARSEASLSYWMAQSAIGSQTWKPTPAQITGVPAQLPVDSFATIGLTAPGVDLTGAQIVWEVKYLEPNVGSTLTFTPKYPGDTWIEAEALLPDGRRVFAKTNFSAMTSANQAPNADESVPVAVGTDTAAIYHLDNTLTDGAGKQAALTLSANARLDGSNLGWMATRSGAALYFADLGDQAKVTIPAASILTSSTAFLSVEAMIYINDFKAYNRGNATILKLEQAWDANLTFGEDMYNGPFLKGGASWSYTGAALKNVLTPKTWHHLVLRIDKTSGYVAKLDGVVIAAQAATEFGNWNTSTPVAVQLGDFDGWIDEVVVRSSTVSSTVISTNNPPTVSLASSASIATAPASINLTATANDSDGSIAKVEFFKAGVKLGEDTAAPFTFPVTGLTAGTYSFTARATDNQGATATSAAISVTVNNTTNSATVPASATFVKTDTTTQGNWIRTYGAEGYTIIGNASLVPSYGGATPSGKQDYTWAASTTDTRALQKVGGSDRISSVWYSATAFDIDFNFADTNSHRVAIYVMDWDNNGRVEQVDLLDATSNSLLTTTNVTGFSQGEYLVWDLRGKVRMHLTRNIGNNAIVEGIFFDASPATTGKKGSLKVKGLTAQGLQLEVSGDTGVTYNIQSSADMKSWTNVGQLNLTASPMTFTDTSTTGAQGLRFYRAAP